MTYKDDFGNVATIDCSLQPAYRGGPMSNCYRISCTADGYLYHVSVHETMGDALEKLKNLSCGTFKEV